jgi:lysophospholipase L1-like esterase
LDWAGFKSALSYTFDDAQPSQIEHYAELEAAGVRMTFYITSGSNSGSAAFDATFSQAVRDGHEMGNHTVHHCYANLTMCANGSATNLDTELDDCTSYIEGHFGQGAVWTAASPYGDTGYDAADAARFFLNRGVQSGTVAPKDNSDPFNLPIHAATEGETVDSFNGQIDGAETAARWLIMLIHTINPTTANWYAPIDISVITGSIAHAKSLGDVWIDSMVNVGAYWRGQKVLSAVTPASTAGGQTWTWTLPAHFPPGKILRVTVDGGTLLQNGTPIPWDAHGYYEISLDAGSLTLRPDPVPPPADILAAGVRWIGRVDTTTPAKPRFSWSGTGFVARFSGTSLDMQLSVSGAAEIFKTVLDGAPQAPFTATGANGTYPLATGLSSDVHTVEVYRQTEGAQGESQLLGLTVGGGGALMDPPAAPARLIELIGDSITCGYGDLGTLSDGECFTTESHWDTYGAVAGRALGAEVSTIAASGRGIVRNYAGDTGGTMPMVYAQILANSTTPRWDFHVEPQAVIINLGTNDISNSKGDPGTPFRDTYVSLLQTVRGNYPHALIVCIIAPLLNGGDLATIQGHIQAAVAARNAAGDARVEFFPIPAQTSDKYACQYHPNVAENMIMADLLTAELRSKLGW